MMTIRIAETVDLSRADILAWLREDDPARLEKLWAAADETRRRHVGDEVHLRGLIEISNHCVRACGYCGLRAGNREIERYRMSAAEILDCARNARAWGWGTVVVMPNLTPPQYRVKYEIYPDKACTNETAEMCRGCLQGRVEAIGRSIGSGPGGRRSFGMAGGET